MRFASFWRIPTKLSADDQDRGRIAELESTLGLRAVVFSAVGNRRRYVEVGALFQPEGSHAELGLRDVNREAQSSASRRVQCSARQIASSSQPSGLDDRTRQQRGGVSGAIDSKPLRGSRSSSSGRPTRLCDDGALRWPEPHDVLLLHAIEMVADERFDCPGPGHRGFVPRINVPCVVGRIDA